MKFKNLKINNFGSIGEVDLPLANRGLVLVCGENKDAPLYDSNGAGKSLLLDALTWCLWGKTIRGLKSDAVVNDRRSKDCQVTLELEEEDDIYTVTRIRQGTNPNYKPNDLILLKNSDMICGSSTTETQKRIDSLLGLDFLSFCAMMPGAMVKPTELTDKGVKELLERILRVEVLSDALQVVKAELKDLELARRKVQTKLESFTQDLKHQEGLVVVYSEKLATFEKDKLAEKAAIEQKLKKVLADLDDINTQLASFPPAEKLKEKEGEVAELSKARKTLWAELEGENNKFIAVQGQLRECIKVSKAEISRLEVSVGQIEDLIGDCPYCLNSLPEDRKGKTLQELRQKIHAAKKECAELSTKLNSSLEEQRRVKESFEIQNQQLRDKESLISKDVETLRGHHNKAAVLEKSKQYIDQNVQILYQNLKSVDEKVNPFQELKHLALESISALQAEISSIEPELRQLEEKIQLLEFWQVGFSPKGVRSVMLEQVMPVLNRLAAKYSQELTLNEMSVEFHTQDQLADGTDTEKFHVQVKQKHGGSSYHGNSAGERARANIIVAWVLGDLAAMRTSKKIPFKFLDEPFEGLDEAGAEAVGKFLNEKAQEYETIFVITHQEYFKQLFQNKITVVKEQGISRLEV